MRDKKKLMKLKKPQKKIRKVRSERGESVIISRKSEMIIQCTYVT